jgi:hypothetical protein
LIDLAHRAFTLIVQAQVFTVLALNLIFCPVVYAVSAGVRAITYVSLASASAAYLNVSDWSFAAMSEGVTSSGLQDSVSVQA